MMKTVWVFTISIFAFIEGQQTGGYFGRYGSNNHYVPHMLIRPTHYSRFLPFGEELVMDSVVEESSYFKIKSKTIKQWLRLSSDHQYLLGIGDREVTLISMYKIKDNSYQAHEYPVDMPHEITCAAMFNTLSSHHGLQQGFVLLGFDSPQPMVVLYKIRKFKIVKVTSWKKEHRVQSVGHFKWNLEDRIVVVEDTNDFSLVHVHGLKFEHHLPHYWHIETLPMEKIEGHPAFGRFQDGSVFMAVIQKMDSMVKVYTYKNVCYANEASLSGSKFELVQSMFPVVARKIEFFGLYDSKYLMTISLNTMLYKIYPEGIIEDTKFTLSADTIVLPASRGGAILLGKSLDGNPHVYTISNPEGQWRELPTPKCRRSGMHVINGTTLEVDLKDCIGGSRSWAGATYIEAEGYPSLLFADRTYPGELYHFSYSTKTFPASYPAVDDTLDELESVWNSLRSNLLNNLLGRSTEVSAHSAQICASSPEITRMYNILLELKDRLALANCSDFQTDLAQQEAGQNVVIDEAKSQEIISDRSCFEQMQLTKEDLYNIKFYRWMGGDQPENPVDFESENRKIGKLLGRPAPSSGCVPNPREFRSLTVRPTAIMRPPLKPDRYVGGVDFDAKVRLDLGASRKGAHEKQERVDVLTLSNNEKQSLFTEPISRLGNQDFRKTTILSPELEDTNWKESLMNDPGMGELIDIYRN